MRRPKRRGTFFAWADACLFFVAVGLSVPAAACVQPEPRAHTSRSASPASGRNVVEALRRDLTRDESRGGHTIARHVARSDADLRARLRRERQIAAASTYPDLDTAERVVAHTLDREADRLRAWLARPAPRPNLALDYQGRPDTPVGRTLLRNRREPVPCWDAVVVLRAVDQDDFYVLTSYPERRP